VCERDKEQLLMLAESISLFLDPCTHYVVINEENPKIFLEINDFLKSLGFKNLLTQELLYKSKSQSPITIFNK
jgi:hypothetical protein